MEAFLELSRSAVPEAFKCLDEIRDIIKPAGIADFLYRLVSCQQKTGMREAHTVQIIQIGNPRQFFEPAAEIIFAVAGFFLRPLLW